MATTGRPQTSGGGGYPASAASASAFSGPLASTSSARGLYRLADARALPPRSSEKIAPFWDIQASEDVGALLEGAPADCIICCAFSMPYADGMTAQAEALDALAAAHPAGFIFASVDIKQSPEVAKWAGVSSPVVRLYKTDGTVVSEVKSVDVASGALVNAVLSEAAKVAAGAQPRLADLAQRFPKALQAEVVLVPCGAGADKMKQHGIQALQGFGAAAAEIDVFTSLCQSCEGGGRNARVRELASLAKVIRQIGDSDLVPFLDLSRRLAAAKALPAANAGEAGAREAIELLLDASLCRGYEAEGAEAPQLMRAALAAQLLANCFGQTALMEALLPATGRLTRTPRWASLWAAVAAAGAGAAGGLARARDAAVAVLLNASVALRVARCRAEHAGLLQAAIAALHCAPDNERLNACVGNLLAVGGTPEDAKRALQAQPLPALRSLAAAVFRGELEEPGKSAFPQAWQPGADLSAGGGAADAAARRPPRGGRVPARHRRGGG